MRIDSRTLFPYFIKIIKLIKIINIKIISMRIVNQSIQVTVTQVLPIREEINNSPYRPYQFNDKLRLI